MIEKSTIQILGKEYTFLKPYACDLIDIEDSCISKDGFNEIEYMKKILKLVDNTIELEDLVKFNGCEVKLSTGETIKVDDIGYFNYKERSSKIKKKTRTNFCKELLKINGVEGNIMLNCFTYDDVNDLANAYFELYDDSELLEVVGKITDFCFQKDNEK